MRRRTRKLIGTLGLFMLVGVWVLFALALAPVAFSSSYTAVPVVFYIVAGLGWLVVAMPLVKWMSRPDPVS